MSAGTFVINGATPTASATPLTATYDGTPKSTVASCSGGGTASNLRYNGSTTAPTNAGSYSLLVDCAASANYGAASSVSAGTFVINAATPTASATPLTATYDGTPKSTVASCSGGGTASNLRYNGSTTAPTNAGSYALLVNCAANTNYTAATNVSAGTFVINGATPTASATPLTATYDGTPKSTVASCSGGGTASNLRYNGSTTAPTIVGTYALLVDCAASANYIAQSNVSAGSFTINPAVDTPSVSNSPQTYTGSPITINVSCLSGGTATSISPSTLTNAGSTAVTAECPGNGNYNATTNAAAGSFTINNANQTASVTNSPQTYTGSPIAAAVTCSGSGAVSNIKYDGSATTPTNAGTYAVTANCGAVTNYNAGTDVADR